MSIALCLSLVMPGNASALCGISSTPLSFGNYDPFSPSPTAVTATVTVDCTVLLGVLMSWSVSLSAGQSGNMLSRSMSNGTSTLMYQIYRDPGRSQVWGDGTSGLLPVIDGVLLAIGSNTFTYTVYGQIPARQNVTVGSYSDTIIATLTF